jgi:protoheme IX farnesyltransferase
MATLEPPLPDAPQRVLRHYLALTKPRIVVLAVFCALIGMLLAAPGTVPWVRVLAGSIGIALLAAAGFVLNCLIERGVDARMARTQNRPVARGDVSVLGAALFAGILSVSGAAVLGVYVNALTLWLTVATFLGYALVYTVLLKPATPQNIVIGGASGAMPPVLGWAAVANEVSAQALVLFLIIFVWTPPHFWALALYRIDDYRRSGLPMLPVTHGSRYTRLHILLYAVLLWATSLLPFVIRMSGWLYLAVAVALGGLFVWDAWRLWRQDSPALARRTFGDSLLYLSGVFAALLVDHWW